MVTTENHENQELASRLAAAADGIVNHAAKGLERDLRFASELIGQMGRAAPLLSQLNSALAKIANDTSDDDTRRRLRRLIGEA